MPLPSFSYEYLFRPTIDFRPGRDSSLPTHASRTLNSSLPGNKGGYLKQKLDLEKYLQKVSWNLASATFKLLSCQIYLTRTPTTTHASPHSPLITRHRRFLYPEKKNICQNSQQKISWNLVLVIHQVQV